MGETLSSGLLLLGRNIMSITVKTLMSLYIFDGESILKTRIGFIILFIIIFIGVIFLHSNKLILKRTSY